MHKYFLGLTVILWYGLLVSMTILQFDFTSAWSYIQVLITGALTLQIASIAMKGN